MLSQGHLLSIIAESDNVAARKGPTDVILGRSETGSRYAKVDPCVLNSGKCFELSARVFIAVGLTLFCFAVDREMAGHVYRFHIRDVTIDLLRSIPSLQRYSSDSKAPGIDEVSGHLQDHSVMMRIRTRVEHSPVPRPMSWDLRECKAGFIWPKRLPGASSQGC